MNPYYYVHINSWMNNDQLRYKYNGHTVGAFVVLESVDQVLASIINTESQNGYCTKSEKLLKVTQKQLDQFNEHIGSIEIDETNTYELNSLCELSERFLGGSNISMRYRKAIYFCEQLTIGSSRLEEQIVEIQKNIEEITEAQERVLALIEEESMLEDSIVYKSELTTASSLQTQYLNECVNSLHKIKETKNLVVEHTVRDLEKILGSNGYKVPMLKFNTASIR